MLLPLLLLAQTQYFSVPQVDAPSLARFGTHDVGVRTIEITNPQQPDILKLDPATKVAPLADRTLKVEVWYPAQLKAGEQAHTVYVSPMAGRAARADMPKTFEIPGKAARDAAPKTGATYPLVIVSHGYPGSRTFLSYLTENLASKGYIVAAIDHTDSVFGEVRGFQSTLVNRAPDQIFTLKTLSSSKDLFLSSIVDPSKAAIIGYSMGGYGAMASGGAAYGPTGGMLKQLPLPKATPPENLKAIVAIAPWGAQPPIEAWSQESAKGLKLPSLFIVGDNDDVSGYEQGVKKLYNWSTASNRCMVTYQNARHNVGGNPAPANVALDFQGRESFEEPVWRKDRITAINQHFITAFLDLNLKGDAAMQAYFKPDEKGAWPGFQRRWFLGLEVGCKNAD
jgi:dienelactone hydrolase